MELPHEFSLLAPEAQGRVPVALGIVKADPAEDRRQEVLSTRVFGDSILAAEGRRLGRDQRGAVPGSIAAKRFEQRAALGLVVDRRAGLALGRGACLQQVR